MSLVVSLFFPRLMKNRRPSVKAATIAKPLHTPKIAQKTLNTKKANVSPLKIGNTFFIVFFFAVDVVVFVISLPSRGVCFCLMVVSYLPKNNISSKGIKEKLKYGFTLFKDLRLCNP